MSVVLIAGCTGGMGMQLLEKLDKGGKFQGKQIAKLIAVDYFLDDAKRQALESRLETKDNLVLHWDASNFTSTKTLVAEIDKVTDHLDGVLITTGMGFHGDLAELTLEDSNRWLQRLLQVNTVGPSLLSQYCAKKLLRSKIAKHGSSKAPTLLVMSSFSGLVGLPHRASYCSSKFGLNGYMEAIHAEFPALRIVLVCPTSVSTNFRNNWKKEAKSVGAAASEVAVNDQADLTQEQCVASVWESFTTPSSSGLQYSILPKGKSQLAYWLIRIPYIGERFVRGQIFRKSSKL